MAGLFSFTNMNSIFWYLIILVFVPSLIALLWGLLRSAGKKMLISKINFIVPVIIIFIFIQTLMLIFFKPIVTFLCNL